ncbi:MAG: FkbM family methyltransferase [Verrucomicrobiota bacterium]|jgi:FkbM family methyltransferase
MFTFRPSTCDYNVFRAVTALNEYRLPEHFDPCDVILDIGAHIGSFTCACLQRGAGQVIAFEPEPENYRLAGAHLAEFGNRVELHPLAVWRSDRPETLLWHSGYRHEPHEVNTGGGDVLFQSGQPDDFPQPNQHRVNTVPFDAVLGRFDRVRLAKLDCEGSEWPILFTSRSLDQVEALCGEYHEIGGKHDRQAIPALARVEGYERYTTMELVAFLQRHFRRVEIQPHGGANLGLFWASR